MINLLGPVVQTPINANPGLDLPYLGLTFNPRLICVARSLINANPGLKGGLTLTHLVRWVNFVIVS